MCQLIKLFFFRCFNIVWSLFFVQRLLPKAQIERVKNCKNETKLTEKIDSYRTWIWSKGLQHNMAHPTVKSATGFPVILESRPNSPQECIIWFLTFRMAVMAKWSNHVEKLLRIKIDAQKNCAIQSSRYRRKPEITLRREGIKGDKFLMKEER